jgi:7-carboxy-7-deazaguanine synthase
MISKNQFLVSEIFTSIQGESSFAGQLCFFIRLAGCNLNCAWCDTRYAKIAKGKTMRLEEIIDAASASKTKLVEITGGEPLLQKNTPELCRKLIAKGFNVLVETNGSFPIQKIPAKVRIILDCKCPSSGESEKMIFANFAKIKKKDEIKFVIADRNDYEYAKEIMSRYLLAEKTDKIFFSPVAGRINHKKLAEWMIADKILAIFAVQLHKIIWGKYARGK